MKQYTFTRARSDIPLGDTVDGTPWEEAAVFRIDEFSRYEGGSKPLTTGCVCYDDEVIYLQFFVEDPHITVAVTELNGPTFEDSSVEVFVDLTPDEDLSRTLDRSPEDSDGPILGTPPELSKASPSRDRRGQIGV